MSIQGLSIETGDLDFLREHGAEMMLEIARFWASIAHYNPGKPRMAGALAALRHFSPTPPSESRSTPRAAADRHRADS